MNGMSNPEGEGQQNASDQLEPKNPFKKCSMYNRAVWTAWKSPQSSRPDSLLSQHLTCKDPVEEVLLTE